MPSNILNEYKSPARYHNGVPCTFNERVIYKRNAVGDRDVDFLLGIVHFPLFYTNFRLHIQNKSWTSAFRFIIKVHKSHKSQIDIFIELLRTPSPSLIPNPHSETRAPLINKKGLRSNLTSLHTFSGFPRINEGSSSNSI